MLVFTGTAQKNPAGAGWDHDGAACLPNAGLGLVEPPRHNARAQSLAVTARLGAAILTQDKAGNFEFS
jgi:hypothetical protein